MSIKVSGIDAHAGMSWFAKYAFTNQENQPKSDWIYVSTTRPEGARAHLNKLEVYL